MERTRNLEEALEKALASSDCCAARMKTMRRVRISKMSESGRASRKSAWKLR